MVGSVAVALVLSGVLATESVTPTSTPAPAPVAPDAVVINDKAVVASGALEPSPLRKWGSNYFLFGGVGRPDREAKFQFSIRYGISTVFRKDVTVNFGFTQTSWWDLYKSSSPFLESNYAPEVFFEWRRSRCLEPVDTTFTNDDALAESKRWKNDLVANNDPCTETGKTLFTNFIGGVMHQSNGLAGDGSRGWDRVYGQTSVRFHFGHGPVRDRAFVELTPRAWWIIDGAMGPMATQPISRYYGFGDLRVTAASWAGGEGQQVELELLLRKGWLENRHGAAQTSLRLRLWPKRCFSPWLVFQWWYGEGQRLLEYNVVDNELRVGLVLND